MNNFELKIRNIEKFEDAIKLKRPETEKALDEMFSKESKEAS